MSNSIQLSNKDQVNLHSLLNMAHHLGAKVVGNFEPVELSVTINNIKKNVNITKLRMKMIVFILRFIINCKGGAFPSHTTIALGVKCKRDAVLQAFKVFEALELFTIQRRIALKVIEGRVCKRQTSNMYRLGATFMHGTVVQYLQNIIPLLQVAYYRCKFGIKHSQAVKPTAFKRNHTLTTNVVNYVNNSSTVLVYINNKVEFLNSTAGKAWRNMMTWIKHDPTVSRKDFEDGTYEYKNKTKPIKPITTVEKIPLPPIIPYSHKDKVHNEAHDKFQAMFAAFIPVDKRIP